MKKSKRDNTTGRFLPKGNRIERYSAYAIIFTYKGEPIYCDIEDIDFLSQYTWCVVNTRLCTHAITNIKDEQGKRKVYWMHRMLLSPPNGVEIDHIDHNGCNNRRANLRLTSHSNNTKNAARRVDNTSGYKGVHQLNYGRWQARIQVDGKRIPLGCYATKEEAAQAYNDAAIKYYGEYAHLNRIILP